jgi:hypothetical protein
MINKAINGDMELFNTLKSALDNPFKNPKNSKLSMPQEKNEMVTATFCGT